MLLPFAVKEANKLIELVMTAQFGRACMVDKGAKGNLSTHGPFIKEPPLYHDSVH